MIKHVTDSPEQFMKWFPELMKCPVCKKGNTLFENIRGLEITIKAQDFYGKKTVFIYNPKAATLNPLADYKS